MANCVQCGRRLPPLTFGKKICQWCVQHEAAQRGENNEEARQHVMPAPWVRRGESTITLTHVLFGANVAVFLAMALASGSVMDFPGHVMLQFGANVGAYTLSGQWWRLLTYMFLHGGLMHIAFNMWCLWDLGALCESLYGRWTYLCIYLLTGVSAGLTSAGWHPMVPSVGASGAIFGLAGALIASFYLGEFSLPSIAIRGTLRSLVFFVGFNVFFGSLFPGIDNAAHGGGLVSGLILGALIARIAPGQDQSFRRVAIVFLMVLLLLGSAVGVQRWRGFGVRFERATIRDNRMDREIGELQKKVRQYPQDASAHYALAHAYFSAARWDDGETELKRVLELQPQNARAHMDLGAVYLNQGQSKEAQDEFTAVVTREPENPTAHIGLGMALADQQGYQSAIKEYKAALQLDPQSKGVYYQLGVSQAALKQYDDAIASYLEEREKNGDEPDLEEALAEAYQAKGMTQQAQEARSTAAQLKGSQ